MAIKKISRREISQMNSWQFLRASVGPYARLLSYLRPYRGRFGLGILFGALFGVSNGVMLLTMQFVFSRVLPGEMPLSFDKVPVIGKWLAAHIASAGADVVTPFWEVVISCSLVPLLIAARGLFSYLNSYYLMWVGVKVLDDIRRQLFERLLAQSMEFFNKAKTGELIQVVFNQTRIVQQALSTICSDLIKQPIAIVCSLGALCMMDWKFTMLSLLVFPLCILPVTLVGRRVRRAGTREEQEAGMLMVVMHEAFAGVRLVKANAREGYEIGRFNHANAKMMSFIMRWQKAVQLIGPLVETVASIGIVLGLVYAWHYQVPARTFMPLYLGLISLYPSVKSLSQIQIIMQKALAATTSVFDMMERQPTIRDAPGAPPLARSRGRIAFEDVTFSYVDGIPAVRGVNLQIPEGTHVALVGESGAGKSTMMSLLLRFYDPQAGRILIDGHDIREVQQDSLRGQMALVSQDTFLFHDTIRENIRYGRLQATDAEVEDAARRAHAHDFIQAQEKGYDTVIGDKGCLLSGGQQQRLSIARAFLRDAPILLLDEAMSSLDSSAERIIQAAVEDLGRGRTVIAIAHRLSTILGADMIVVMDRGEVQQVGRHEELLAISPIYQRLYRIQFGQEDGTGAVAPPGESGGKAS